MELDTEVGVIMAGQLRWLLVLILSDTVFSTPGLVMVREEGGREKREVREELERWRSALRSDLLGRNSDGIEEMEVRKRREVGAETGKRIEIKSNDAIAPTITKSNDAIGPTILKARERKYRRLEHSIMVQADIRSRSVIFIFIFIFFFIFFFLIFSSLSTSSSPTSSSSSSSSSVGITTATVIISFSLV